MLTEAQFILHPVVAALVSLLLIVITAVQTLNKNVVCLTWKRQFVLELPHLKTLRSL